MSDSLMKQFAPRHALEQSRAEADGNDVDDLVVLGYLRGRERAIMLELRKKDGASIALGYAWLERIELDASTGITMYFGRQTVRIIGRNLNAEVRPNLRLIDALTRHKVTYMQESGGAAAMAAAKDAVVIERIEFL